MKVIELTKTQGTRVCHDSTSLETFFSDETLYKRKPVTLSLTVLLDSDEFEQLKMFWKDELTPQICLERCYLSKKSETYALNGKPLSGTLFFLIPQMGQGLGTNCVGRGLKQKRPDYAQVYRDVSETMGTIFAEVQKIYAAAESRILVDLIVRRVQRHALYLVLLQKQKAAQETWKECLSVEKAVQNSINECQEDLTQLNTKLRTLQDNYEETEWAHSNTEIEIFKIEELVDNLGNTVEVPKISHVTEGYEAYEKLLNLVQKKYKGSSRNKLAETKQMKQDKLRLQLVGLDSFQQAFTSWGVCTATPRPESRELPKPTYPNLKLTSLKDSQSSLEEDLSSQSQDISLIKEEKAEVLHKLSYFENQLLVDKEETQSAKSLLASLKTKINTCKRKKIQEGLLETLRKEPENSLVSLSQIAFKRRTKMKVTNPNYLLMDPKDRLFMLAENTEVVSAVSSFREFVNLMYKTQEDT